jgi:hypothetical protein
MPESHQRHKSKHHHQQGGNTDKKVKTTAGIFMAAMGGIFGLSFDISQAIDLYSGRW